MRPAESVEFQLALVLEAEVAGALGQLFDNGGGDDLAAAGPCGSFPDFDMEIVDLIAEGDKVVAHFKCSGTHKGEWRGVAPSGKRLEGVDEIYIFRIVNGKLASAVAVEDNLARMRQLGFEL